MFHPNFFVWSSIVLYWTIGQVLTPLLLQRASRSGRIAVSSSVDLKVNDRDRAEMDRGDNSSDADDEERKPAEQSTTSVAVEVSNVAVSSMIRMATVDK